MKELVLLLIFVIISSIFIIMPSAIAKCCEDIKDPATGKILQEGGCYPDRPICCIQGDKNIGYIGCKYATKENPTQETDFAYICPGAYIGHSQDQTACLICSSSSKDLKDCKPDGTGCTWIKNDAICKDLSCNVEYTNFEDKDFPLYSQCTYKCMEGEVWDTVNGECVEVENPRDAICENAKCASGKFCCGSDGTKKDDGKGSVCSGDNDKDGICNYYDNCEDVPNTEILGTCLPLTIKQTCTKAIPCPQEGICSNNREDINQDGIGDACQYEVSCESSYGDRQCCDELDPTATSKAGATFFGFIGHCTKESLGDVFRGIGCWSECVIKDKTTGIEITFEVGPCMDGQRTITKLQDGKAIETKKEACSGIPLIPFFTNINLLFTLLILTLFYYFREK